MSLRRILARAAEQGLTLELWGGERRGWGEVFDAARARATALREDGVRPGDRVVIADRTGAPLIEAFLAAHWLGAVPILLAPIVGRGTAEGERIDAVARESGARRVLLGAEAYKRHAGSLACRERLRSLEAGPPGPLAAEGPEHPLATVQFSSGSTRAPRGVRVSHEGFAANLAAIARVAEVRAEDVVVSWLPLHHDMGLVAGLFGGPAWGAATVLIDPLRFLRRPGHWLRAISERRGTISMAPNFGFAHAANLVRDEDLEGVDLSSWRIAWNGAEMVRRETIRSFEARFRRFGLRPNLVVPCYGAAEATLMITSCPPERGLRTFLADREALAAGRCAAGQGEGAVELISVGPVPPGFAVEIDAPAETVGEILVRGSTVSPGYDDGEDASLEGGTWRSGDLGVLLEGELYIVGRKKDLIVVNGRNLHPDDLEGFVRDRLGASVRAVVAVGVPDPRSGTERVVVAIELVKRERDGLALESLAATLAARAGAPVEIRVVEQIPRTTSGKPRRACTKAALVP